MPSANVHRAAECKQRNKQMAIEYNNSYVLRTFNIAKCFGLARSSSGRHYTILTEYTNCAYCSIIDKYQHMPFFTFNTVLV